MMVWRAVGMLAIGALAACCQSSTGPSDGSHSPGGTAASGGTAAAGGTAATGARAGTAGVPGGGSGGVVAGDPYVLFADRDGGPRGLSSNSTHLFWVEGGQIWRGLKTGAGEPVALSVSGRNARRNVLVADEERVYFVNGDSLALVPVTGGDVEKVPLGDDFTHAELLQDATAVYLVDRECRKIAKVSKANLGVALTTVKEMDGLTPKLAGAAGQDAERVYCGTGRHLLILAYEKATGTTSTLFDATGDPRISIDDAFSGVVTTDDAYYWMADDAYNVPYSRHELWRLSRETSKAEKIFEIEVTGQISQLLYDKKRDQLYWNTGESILEYDIATGKHRLLTDKRWMGGGETMDDTAVYWTDHAAIGRVLKAE